MSWFSRQTRRPVTLRPIVRPTRVFERNIYEPYIVPVIHPSHTRINRHKIFEYRHFCPHTVSHHTTVSCRNVNCGCHGYR